MLEEWTHIYLITAILPSNMLGVFFTLTHLTISATHNSSCSNFTDGEADSERLKLPCWVRTHMAYKKQSQDSKLDLPKPTDQTDGIQLSGVDSDPLEIRRQGRLLWRKKIWWKAEITGRGLRKKVIEVWTPRRPRNYSHNGMKWKKNRVGRRTASGW